MDLIDKRDEVLRLFLEHGITENAENNLTKTDLAECAEEIVKTFSNRELLIDFFLHFRNNGEQNIGMSIEQFVDDFLSVSKKCCGRIRML